MDGDDDDFLSSSQPTTEMAELLNTRAPSPNATPSPSTSQEEPSSQPLVRKKRKLQHKSLSSELPLPDDDLSARERIHQTLAVIPYPKKSWRGAIQPYHSIRKKSLPPEETKKEDGTRLTRHSESLRRQRQFRLFNDILEVIPCMDNPTDVVNGESSIHNNIGALTQIKVYIRHLQDTVTQIAPYLLPQPGMLTLLDLYKLSNHPVPHDTGEIFVNKDFDGFKRSLS